MLFIRLTLRVFRERWSNFVFGFMDEMWDLIVLIPDHCLSIYFVYMHFIEVVKIIKRINK